MSSLSLRLVCGAKPDTGRDYVCAIFRRLSFSQFLLAQSRCTWSSNMQYAVQTGAYCCAVLCLFLFHFPAEQISSADGFHSFFFVCVPACGDI